MAFLDELKQPECSTHQEQNVLSVFLSGDWVVTHGSTLEKLVASHLKASRGTTLDGVERLVVDISGVDHMDTCGAWLIRTLVEGSQSLVSSPEDAVIRGATQDQRMLMDQLSSYEPDPNVGHGGSWTLRKFLDRVGHTTMEIARDAVAMLTIVGALASVVLEVAFKPKRLRAISVLVQFDRTCIGAVPIIALMSFLIGAIIAQQGGFYLRQFGADLFVVDLSGVLVLREIGVLLTAIMVAGRSGSAFTAELGSMKMQEEIDALHVMGMSVTEVLILPRLLALMLALPVLTFISDMAALLGAGLVSWWYLGIPPAAYLARLQDAVTVQTVFVGMLKAPFMAAIVGLIACVEGMKVGGSATSLGNKTTMSVVKAIFLVIVVDGFFAIFFAAVNI